ncbi:MAG: hypothetical protein HKO13_02630 [Sphingomonas sp.]|nr:hypothetical protein [Sphingomonas sp.]
MLFASLLLATAAPAETIGGTWTVDLSPAGDGSYTQPMTLEANEDGTLGGTFYGTSIERGRWAENSGRTCISFVTSDNSGAYLHAGCLTEGGMDGQSFATGRSTLFLWKATR